MPSVARQMTALTDWGYEAAHKNRIVRSLSAWNTDADDHRDCGRTQRAALCATPIALVNSVECAREVLRHSVVVPLHHRHGEGERRPAVLVVLRPEPAAVGLD